MAEPAGSRGKEQEQVLAVRGETRVARGASPGGNPPVTRGMKVALFGGASVFTFGALFQMIAVAWLAIAAALAAVSGTILVHTGGLEPETFATCVTAAIVADAVLLLAIVGAWVTKVGRRELALDPGGYYVRHPVRATAAGLLAALLVVTLAGWKRSVYFPYPLATIVVLANAYFFAVVGAFAVIGLIDRAWRPLRTWAEISPYRAGFLTATLVLLGAAGFILRELDWYEGPVRRINAEIHLGRTRDATGFADAQLKVLCIAAEETAPQHAHGDSAPGCGFLTEGGGTSDGGGTSGGAAASGGSNSGAASDCFKTLSEEVQTAKGIVRHKYRLNAYDADDVVMHALVATCTREPLPAKLRAYFWKVANTRGQRVVESARRTVSCDSLDEATWQACSYEPPEEREALLSLLWERALCELDDREARALRGRLEGLPFRAVGEQLGLGADKAKDLFHNTLNKLRRRLKSCLPELQPE